MEEVGGTEGGGGCWGRGDGEKEDDEGDEEDMQG